MLDQFHRVYKRNAKIIHFAYTASLSDLTICGFLPDINVCKYWEREVSGNLIQPGDRICKKCQKALDKAGLI